MIRLVAVTLGLAVGLGFLFAGPAAADPIPVSWSYRNPLNEIAFPHGATGGLAFPNTEFRSFKADQSILASTLSSYSIARESEPDVVSRQQYGFALDLRDDASGEIARLQFKGILSGEIWRTGANLSNQYLEGSTQTATLGGNVYSVSLTDFESPSGYGDTFAGSFRATVRVNQFNEPDSTTDTPPNTTPEPTTLIIAGVGLAGSGLVRLRSWTVRDHRRRV